MQFLRLCCCVPHDFLVQINNFFRLVLFSAVIYKRTGKKLISKTIKYKLDSSLKTQFVFFYYKDIQNFFLENYRFCRKSGNDSNCRGWGGGSYSLCHDDAIHTKIIMWFTLNFKNYFYKAFALYLHFTFSTFSVYLWLLVWSPPLPVKFFDSQSQ